MRIKIEVGEGEHEIVGDDYQMMNVTCNNITFVGKGKDQTTIRGGFKVRDKQNVKFEELTVTNSSGLGLYLCGSETNVDVLKCTVKECKFDGMYVGFGATVTATRCDFMENDGAGVHVLHENTSKIK